MSEKRVSNELLYEVLKNIQADISTLKKMRSEMREGFAASRSHMQASQKDAIFFEGRLISVESDIEKIKKRLDLLDD